MSNLQIALWIFGPTASGKTTLLSRLPSGFQLIDQDAVLEMEMIARGFSLDMRTYDPAQATAFAALRREVAGRVWAHAPAARARRVPLAFEVTGDKPHLLQIEVEADRATGYRSIGVGLRCPLATCLERNRRRRRILPDQVVEICWHAVEQNVSNGVYVAIFGEDSLIIPTDPAQFEVAAWLQSMHY